ncbi:MAG: ribonuclease III [Acidobacteriota bacterium]|nr:ribonuclease III [Acidobacteriota bacterium]
MHAEQEALEALETAAGHRFRNRDLLRRALTHRSRVHDDQSVTDNEQLEFLGDAILGFLTSEALVARYPDWPEGRLSKLKARLVCAAHLYEVAQALGIGKYIILGRAEERNGGRERKALLSDALEALIAALYLDAGLVATRAFVLRQIVGDAPSDDSVAEPVTNYKSALQEMAQALKLPLPRYQVVEERGPEHAKTIIVQVSVGRDWISLAEGVSKKDAGQRAAQQVLQQLTDWGR